MKVAVYHSNSDIRIEDRPRPVAGPGELVFRVRASGVCGSDVMEWYRLPKAPLVLGHEVAGEVVEAGEGAAFAVGDRIVTTHHVPCGTCRACRAGREPACPTFRSTSFDPGGFAEYVRLPALNVTLGTLVVPARVSFEEASFVEPLACVVRAQRLASVAGRSMAVLGSGVSGLLHILWARRGGADRIVATDVHPFRIEAAKRAGADEVVDVRTAKIEEKFEVVVVSTGVPSAIAQAFDIVDRGGTVVVFAPSLPAAGVPVTWNDLWLRGISVIPSYAGPPNDMRTALAAIAAKEIDVGSLITHRLPLDAAGEAFRLVVEAGESMKVVLVSPIA